MSTEALLRAVAIVGGQAELARRLGKRPQHVWNWIDRGRVPVDVCPGIERTTGGAVTCEELRPDVDWYPFRAMRIHPIPGPQKRPALSALFRRAMRNASAGQKRVLTETVDRGSKGVQNRPL